MDHARALNIVSTLANGVNPLTGEVFPSDSPYQSSDIVRALFLAARALESGASEGSAASAPARTNARESRTRSSSLPNVGKPWTPQEDEQLLAEFDRGRTPRELAAQHGRTLAGIEARLEKFGRITAQQRVTTNRFSRERGASDEGGRSASR